MKTPRRSRNQFPRTADLPLQSSKYWAKEKDRYLRQLLISDIEETTGRELVVFFSRLDQPIIPPDADDISEVLEGVKSTDIDLLIQTPGGEVDAVEKIVATLRQRNLNYRVIVPSWAKSGGTVIALSSEKILLGINSELGPIDPQMLMDGLGFVPAEFIAADENAPFVVRKLAETSVDRARKLAAKYLSEGMLSGKAESEIEVVVTRISSPTSYGSHGAVIDFTEAQELGLSVEWMPPEEDLWRRIWLLHCSYEYDIRHKALGKIVEGAVNSISRQPLKLLMDSDG